jgi:anti-sigma B factor antagonist
MKIERIDDENVTTLIVRGPIKLGESAKNFSGYLEEVLKEGVETVFVDLENIDLVDSTGLGELVGYLQRFEEEGRRMAFINPAVRLRKLFELTRLDEVMPIYEDRVQAMAALAAD